MSTREPVANISHTKHLYTSHGPSTRSVKVSHNSCLLTALWVILAFHTIGSRSYDQPFVFALVLTDKSFVFLPYLHLLELSSDWAGNFDEALAVISNIEMQTTDNMCVLNHKLNLLRRHGDDLNDLFTSYIDKKELNADCVKLLTSKYSRYLLKVHSVIHTLYACGLYPMSLCVTVSRCHLTMSCLRFYSL